MNNSCKSPKSPAEALLLLWEGVGQRYLKTRYLLIKKSKLLLYKRKIKRALLLRSAPIYFEKYFLSSLIEGTLNQF
jgi:hypothetical protein